MTTTAVEINDSVIAASRHWFALPTGAPRLRIERADAAVWLAEPSHSGQVDALCVDLYDHDAASPVLDSGDFYRACHAVLADGGAMTVNLFGRDASFERSAARIAAAFGRTRVASVQPTKEGNTVVVAIKTDAFPSRDTLAARAAAVESAYPLPARKWLRMIRNLPGATTPIDDLSTSDAAAVLQQASPK